MRQAGRLTRAPERGAGTVLALGLTASLLILLTMALVAGAALTASNRARSAADLAALAGAGELLLGRDESQACRVAAEITRRNGARLERCSTTPGGEIAGAGASAPQSLTVQVAVALPVPEIGPARARSRAGGVAEGTGG